MHYPILPVRWLLRDRYASGERIARIGSPLLVIAGDRDSVIPLEQSRRLYDAAVGVTQGTSDRPRRRSQRRRASRRRRDDRRRRRLPSAPSAGSFSAVSASRSTDASTWRPSLPETFLPALLALPRGPDWPPAGTGASPRPCCGEDRSVAAQAAERVLRRGEILVHGLHVPEHRFAQIARQAVASFVVAREMMLTRGETLLRGAAIPARGLFLRRDAAGLFERESQVDLSAGKPWNAALRNHAAASASWRGAHAWREPDVTCRRSESRQSHSARRRRHPPPTAAAPASPPRDCRSATRACLPPWIPAPARAPPRDVRAERSKA